MSTHLESGRFFGRTVARRVACDLVLADVRYPAGARLPRHSHERAYFCLIRNGTYDEDFGRRHRTCRPMTLAFHPPGEPHAQAIDSRPVSSFNVEIGGRWLDRVRDAAGPLDQPVEFHGGETVSLALQLFREFREADPLAIESLAFEILSTIAGPRPAPQATPAWLAASRELLDACFAEPLSLHSLALRAGVHPVHFAVSFRRFLGCSPGEYVRRRRIECARQKLAQPDLALAEIALDAGFADQSHLTRTFKRFTGMTPAQYRTFLRFKTA